LGLDQALPAFIKEFPMTTFYLVGAFIALILLVYLFVALLKPELF
jgi:K+-transporting ATPase KdpF subunit